MSTECLGRETGKNFVCKISLSYWVLLTLERQKGRFLGIISRDPSVSKSIRLHVVIFGFVFTNFEVYSTDSSTMKCCGHDTLEDDVHIILAFPSAQIVWQWSINIVYKVEGA